MREHDIEVVNRINPRVNTKQLGVLFSIYACLNTPIYPKSCPAARGNTNPLKMMYLNVLLNTLQLYFYSGTFWCSLSLVLIERRLILSEY